MHRGYVQHNGLLVHPDDLPALRDAGLDSFDALLAAEGQANLDKPGLAAWRERHALDVGGLRYYLKRYGRPPLRERLAHRLQGSRAAAEVEWRWLHRVRGLGILAPRPVALGVRAGPLGERASLLLLAEVPGQSLEKRVAAELSRGPLDPALRDRLSSATAALVAKLHGARLIHRDLYLAHLFLEHGTDDRPRLWLIDLHRMIRPRLRWRRWVIKDLAALNYSVPAAAASQRDRLRWFKRYRGVRRLTADDRALLRRIVRKTAAIARHTVKRGL